MVKKIKKRPVRRLSLPRSRQSQTGTKVPRTVIAHGTDTRWRDEQRQTTSTTTTSTTSSTTTTT